MTKENRTLVRLVFQEPQEPDDYQSTCSYSAEDFPEYGAAPDLLAALELIAEYRAVYAPEVQRIAREALARVKK